jgi:hypothetical protein
MRETPGPRPKRMSLEGTPNPRRRGTSLTGTRPPAGAGTSGAFDLRAASARLYPFTRHQRRVLIATAIFLVLLGAVFLLGNWTGIAHRSLSGYQWVDVSIVYAIVVGGLVAILWSLPRLVRGAISVRVDDSGLELTYSDGRSVRKLWSDSDLEFELIDFTGANPATLHTADLPHSIRMQGVRSLLTTPAYDAIIHQVEQNRLTDAVSRGGRWLFPADANPTIHRVRSATPPRLAR